MGRQRQPQIRQGLLDACTDYALEHGLPDRLGPLATAAGTSTRMLIYHFGTRDGLLREILGHARRRQVEAFTDLLRVRPEEPYPATLSHAWTAMTGPHGQPYLRMFSRLHDTAGEPLWPGFRRSATTDWLAPLEDGMGSLGRPELATVVLAVIRGLLMDLDATGDAERTQKASRTSSPRSRAPNRREIRIPQGVPEVGRNRVPLDRAARGRWRVVPKPVPQARSRKG